MDNEKSFREERIRKITSLYYSRPEIQEAIFNFSKNREICPRYFEGFGKRPDSFQYKNDIFGLVKKGATSFHCSQELWEDPLKIVTGMNESEYNNLRIGWDLLIDIDSKYFDYSKICAEVIINILNFHGVKNVGIKFSGSKGLHLLIPWKAFPKELNGMKTSNMFPELPRIITKYLIEKIKKQLIKKITELSISNKYVRDSGASKEVMPDLVLVSPRHLFRMPYSLHEKTSLSSVVIKPSDVSSFELKDADPLKVKVMDFMPNSRAGEASELLVQALDWNKENANSEKKVNKDFSNNQVVLKNLSDINFPPCTKNILNGMIDGKKRALFCLINIFRSVGIEKEELENIITEWNSKNNPKLIEGYIKSQLDWSYKRKSIMPPNCKEFYQGIGVCNPDSFCSRVKNPVNYLIKKSLKDVGEKENPKN